MACKLARVDKRFLLEITDLVYSNQQSVGLSFLGQRFRAAPEFTVSDL